MYNREKQTRPISKKPPTSKPHNYITSAKRMEYNGQHVQGKTAQQPRQEEQEKRANIQAISGSAWISPAIMEAMMNRNKGVRGRTKERSQLKRRIKNDPFLTMVENYLRYERRHSEYGITKDMSRIDMIVRRYKVTKPTREDAYRIEADLRKKNYAANTIRGYLWALKYMAMSQGEDLKLKMPKKTKKRVDYIRPEEYKIIMDAAGRSRVGVRDQAIVSLMVFTGLRRKEVVNLDLDDVDLERQLVAVRDRGKGIKNYEENTSYIKSECIPYLKAWLEVRPDTISSTFFTSDTNNQRLSGCGLYQILKRIEKRANFDRSLHPHMCRHTCGTWLTKNGVSLALVQRQLRHKDVQSTMIYVHPDEDALRDNIEAKLKF